MTEIPWDTVPIMFADLALPLGEQERARMVQQNLNELDRQLSRFEESLALFDYCEVQAQSIREATPRDRFGHRTYPKLHQSMLTWRIFASREGAMAIWDFAVAMHLTRSNLDHCPTINALVPRRELESALAAFHRGFPDAKKIRHAVAHPVDIFGTPGERKKNSFTGSYEAPGVKIANAIGLAFSDISGRNVAVTIYGEIISYELSQASVKKLTEVASAVHAVCLEAQKYTMKRFLDLFLAGKVKGTPNYTGDDE